MKATLYDDEESDVFIRDPFVVKFKTRCLPTEKDEANIVVIGIHTQVTCLKPTRKKKTWIIAQPLLYHSRQTQWQSCQPSTRL